MLEGQKRLTQSAKTQRKKTKRKVATNGTQTKGSTRDCKSTKKESEFRAFAFS